MPETSSPARRPGRLRAAIQGVGIAAGLATAGSPWAQSVPDAGRVLEESKPIIRPALPPENPPKLIEAPVRPTVTMPEGASVTVSAFKITGATSFPDAQLAELVRPWVGRKLDINGLNDAAGAITRYYQAAGHLLSYAYLPAQQVADGVIEIAVLEGRLEGVQIVSAQDVRLHDDVVQSHTDPVVELKPLVQPDVERQLLLLNDIPGVAARAAFTPGTTTGAAEMVVSVAEDEPMAYHVEFNNYGTRSTGEYRLGLGVELHDLFGWGDSTEGNLLVSNHGSLVAGTLAGSLPLGGNGWRVGANISHLTYQLAGSFADLGATGNADTAGVDFSFPFVRTSDANLTGRASYTYKRLQDDIQLIGTSNPRRNGVGQLSALFDRRFDWGGAAAGSVSLDSGDLQLLDAAAKTQDAATLQTDRSYRKLSTQLAYRQALYGPLSLYFRIAGQATGGNLDSSEKLGLGGPGAVRAYAPGEAAVDQGGVATSEFRITQDYLGGSLLWALFYDHGAGGVDRRPVPGTTGNDARLSGGGLAVQWSGPRIDLSASVAWRGKHVPTAEGGDQSPRIYLQMVLTP